MKLGNFLFLNRYEKYMGWSPILFRRSKLNINIFTAYNRWLSYPRWMGTRGTFFIDKKYFLLIYIYNVNSNESLGIFYFLIDMIKVWDGAPFYFVGRNSILIYLLHSIAGHQIPAGWISLVRFFQKFFSILSINKKRL